MDAAIARECQEIVRQAAGPVAPGSTVKAQIRNACRNLGYKDGNRRVRVSWCGEAGGFSAGAVRDLQQRYLAWREAHQRRAAAAADLAKQRHADGDRVLLESIRTRHLADLARIEARLAVFPEPGGSDPA